jgi:hypothetical protein
MHDAWLRWVHIPCATLVLINTTKHKLHLVILHVRQVLHHASNDTSVVNQMMFALTHLASDTDQYKVYLGKMKLDACCSIHIRLCRRFIWMCALVEPEIMILYSFCARYKIVHLLQIKIFMHDICFIY